MTLQESLLIGQGRNVAIRRGNVAMRNSNVEYKKGNVDWRRGNFVGESFPRRCNKDGRRPMNRNHRMQSGGSGFHFLSCGKLDRPARAERV